MVIGLFYTRTDFFLYFFVFVHVARWDLSVAPAFCLIFSQKT